MLSWLILTWFISHYKKPFLTNSLTSFDPSYHSLCISHFYHTVWQLFSYRSVYSTNCELLEEVQLPYFMLASQHRCTIRILTEHNKNNR